MTRGTTLPELVSALLIVCVMASVGIPPAKRLLDRAAVWGAADRLAAMHEGARHAAVTGARMVRYEVDPAAARLTLSRKAPSGVWDTLKVVGLAGVRVTASQRTVTFDPLGMGSGASNATVILAAGAVVETLTVSRTGRLRRW